MAQISTSEHSFRVECDQIEVTRMNPMSPDPAWSFADTHGHVHTHASGTWAWVVTDTYFVDDGDGYMDEMEDGEYRCTICAEKVEPRFVSVGGGFREFVPGLQHFYIDEREVTEEQFRAAYEQARLT